VSDESTPFGPLPGRRLAQTAARALEGHESDDVAAAVPIVRGRLRRLGQELRFEDAARLRDRLQALETAVEALAELDRLRGLSACVVVPARQPGFVRAHAIASGQVAAVRLVPRGPGAAHEACSLVAEAERASRSTAPEDADELRLVASFLRRPPPELRVTRLDAAAICALVDGIPLAA
jgi:DNA polymerase-3 subunit epsilon